MLDSIQLGRASGAAPRRGIARRRLLATLAILGVLVGGVAYWWAPRGSAHGDDGPMLHLVERADFLHDIVERGELESASNLEIRCEVKSLNTSGTTILEIVPEGTVVKAGDVVARLDSSALENDRTRQQMAVANSEAELIRAKTVYETAVMTKEEYLKGAYSQLLLQLESDAFVASENLRRAEEYQRYSEMLRNKGYITDSQLEADAFAAKKAGKDLDVATKKMSVLKDFTLRKMLAQLDSDVKTSEAKLKAQQHSHELEQNKLADIETQLAKCTVTAPTNGQVVYANVTNGWGGREVIIEAGVSVRERQPIIRLPDHTKMQVKAKINEAKVAMIVKGMSASVRLDAFPDRDFRGEVERVNEYPAPSNRYTSSAKEYETTIRVIDPPPSARPGLTAETRIHVEYLPGVVQIPVQAVFEHSEKHYCIVNTDEGFKPLEVKVGSTNDKFVVVREGLDEGQAVVLNAASLRAKVGLPDLPTAQKASAVASGSSEKPRPNGDAPRRHSRKAAESGSADPARQVSMRDATARGGAQP